MPDNTTSRSLTGNSVADASARLRQALLNVLDDVPYAIVLSAVRAWATEINLTTDEIVRMFPPLTGLSTKLYRIIHPDEIVRSTDELNTSLSTSSTDVRIDYALHHASIDDDTKWLRVVESGLSVGRSCPHRAVRREVAHYRILTPAENAAQGRAYVFREGAQTLYPCRGGETGRLCVLTDVDHENYDVVEDAAALPPMRMPQIREEWRELLLGERIEEVDQYLAHDGTWVRVTTADVGLPVGTGRGFRCYPVRRRIAIAPDLSTSPVVESQDSSEHVNWDIGTPPGHRVTVDFAAPYGEGAARLRRMTDEARASDTSVITARQARLSRLIGYVGDDFASATQPSTPPILENQSSPDAAPTVEPCYRILRPTDIVRDGDEHHTRLRGRCGNFQQFEDLIDDAALWERNDVTFGYHNNIGHACGDLIVRRRCAFQLCTGEEVTMATEYVMRDGVTTLYPAPFSVAAGTPRCRVTDVAAGLPQAPVDRVRDPVTRGTIGAGGGWLYVEEGDTIAEGDFCTEDNTLASPSEVGTRCHTAGMWRRPCRNHVVTADAAEPASEAVGEGTQPYVGVFGGVDGNGAWRYVREGEAIGEDDYTSPLDYGYDGSFEVGAPCPRGGMLRRRMSITAGAYTQTGGTDAGAYVQPRDSRGRFVSRPDTTDGEAAATDTVTNSAVDAMRERTQSDPGYRLMGADEVIVAEDQFLADTEAPGEWIDVGLEVVGRTVQAATGGNPRAAFRRPHAGVGGTEASDPAPTTETQARPTYRVLRIGEVVAEGDEFLPENNEYDPDAVWCAVFEGWVGITVNEDTRTFRRRDENYVILSSGERLCPFDYHYGVASETMYPIDETDASRGLLAGWGTHCRYYVNFVRHTPTDIGTGCVRVCDDDIVQTYDERWASTLGLWVAADHSVGRRAGTCMVFRRCRVWPEFSERPGPVTLDLRFEMEGRPAANVLPAQPGEGWRLLNPHEVIVEGDEISYRASGTPRWFRLVNVRLNGTTVCGSAVIRRRVEAEALPMYRILSPSEPVRDGDEYARDIEVLTSANASRNFSLRTAARQVNNDTAWEPVSTVPHAMREEIEHARLFRRQEHNYIIRSIGEPIGPDAYHYSRDMRTLRRVELGVRGAGESAISLAGYGTHCVFRTSPLPESSLAATVPTPTGYVRMPSYTIFREGDLLWDSFIGWTPVPYLTGRMVGGRMALARRVQVPVSTLVALPSQPGEDE